MIRGGRLGSSAKSSPAFPSVLRWEMSVLWVRQQFYSAQAKTGTDHIKKILSLPAPGSLRRQEKKLTRCARKQSTPSLQALAGKRVVTSLLGHSSLVALCCLVFSQEGLWGP